MQFQNRSKGFSATSGSTVVWAPLFDEEETRQLNSGFKGLGRFEDAQKLIKAPEKAVSFFTNV